MSSMRIPIPPSQWHMALQRSIDIGTISMSSTLHPVVENPATDSKKQLMNENWLPQKYIGTAPKREQYNQLRNAIKYPSLARMASFSDLILVTARRPKTMQHTAVTAKARDACHSSKCMAVKTTGSMNTPSISVNIPMILIIDLKLSPIYNKPRMIDLIYLTLLSFQ